MRITTVIFESNKFDENRPTKDQYDYKRRRDKKDENISFSEILRRTQQNTYLDSKQ
jgi:hypothetical protein